MSELREGERVWQGVRKLCSLLSFVPKDNIVSWSGIQKYMPITGWTNRRRVLAPNTWAEELMMALWGVGKVGRNTVEWL